MNYCPDTEQEIQEMLSAIGINSIANLFDSVPEDMMTKSFDLPAGLSEIEVFEKLKKLSRKNCYAQDCICFLGGGIYDHFIPAAVDALSSRAEFYTAYTPYQPECSQGTLQALFEYQTAICRITGMDVTNSSLYDGGTALAEAALMAVRITGRKKILIDRHVNPFYLEVLNTYLKNRDIELIIITSKSDAIDRNLLKPMLDESMACFIFQNPNFFGSIDNYSDVSEMAHEKGILSVESVYPVSLGLIQSPGESGADIAAGDGQSLGNTMSFGGPSFGFIAAKRQFIRQIPGRIVGETVDKNGERCFVLTLQAREQHIKRQKATSNICSNESLCALRAIIYLSLIGNSGFKKIAELNYNKTEFAKGILSQIKGVRIWNKNPTFNEFILELPVNAADVVKKLLEKNIIGGLPLGSTFFNNYYKNTDNLLLSAFTEKRTKIEILSFAEELEAVLWN